MLHVTNGDCAAERIRADPDQVHRDFVERDRILAASSDENEVVLWFEHDLYDQLQLIQLLDWCADHPHPRLTLVNPAEYLGNLPPDRMRELFASSRPERGPPARCHPEGAAAQVIAIARPVAATEGSCVRIPKPVHVHGSRGRATRTRSFVRAQPSAPIQVTCGRSSG